MESGFGSELLRNVIIILHVGDDSSKTSVLSGLTKFRRVGLDIARSNDNLVVLLRVTIVLLQVLIVFHVLEVGFVEISPDVLSRSEGLLISDLDLMSSILFSEHGLRSDLEGVTDAGVGGWLGEGTVTITTLLHGACAHVGRVDLDLLDVSTGYQSG